MNKENYEGVPLVNKLSALGRIKSKILEKNIRKKSESICTI